MKALIIASLIALAAGQLLSLYQTSKLSGVLAGHERRLDHQAGPLSTNGERAGHAFQVAIETREASRATAEEVRRDVRRLADSLAQLAGRVPSEAEVRRLARDESSRLAVNLVAACLAQLDAQALEAAEDLARGGPAGAANNAVVAAFLAAPPPTGAGPC